jgi:5-methylcytosine-specific restriction endonuclease McrA
MTKRALILDSTYRPLGLISWKKAVALVWLEKAEVLEEYDELLRSPSFEMKIPAVVRLSTYVRTKEPKLRFSKRNLYTRDRGACQYCKKDISYDSSTYDHVVPRAQGGRTTWENIVISCSKCNEFKDDRTPAQAGLPRVSPRVPSHWQLMRIMIEEMGSVPEQWRFYLQGSIT